MYSRCTFRCFLTVGLSLFIKAVAVTSLRSAVTSQRAPAEPSEGDLSERREGIALARLRSVPSLNGAGGPPARGPAPVPFPFPMPAPAPVPGTTPATAPGFARGPSSGLDVHFSITVQNVDYNRLSLDGDLLDRFDAALNKVIAMHSGVGVLPGDVKLELAAGSVIVQATVVTPGGIQPTSIRDTLQKSCTDGSLADALQSAVEAVPGIAAFTTGAVEVDGTAVGECEPILGEAIFAPTATGHKPQVQTDATSDEICVPACMAGRGSCVDNVCFCKAPFAGKICETQTITGSLRLSYLLVTSTSIVIALVGSQIAMLFYGSLVKRMFENKIDAGASGPVKETWKPRPAESSRQ